MRTASCHGDGTGTTEGGPHPHSRWYSTDACRQGRNQDHPYRLLRRDAVESGLVASLARPGGNLTGVSGLTAGLGTKRLELLKEAVPSATRVAILWNPENLTGVPQRNRIALAAETLGVEPRILEARSPSEIDNAFAVAVREQSNGMLVLADPSFTSQRKRIAGL